MKIEIEKGYISIISSKLVWFFGLWSGHPRLAKAVAFFPLIIFRSHEEKIPWIINHEKIHLRQQLETAFVGTFILSFLETIYAKFVLGKTFKEAYLWRSSEQEAYQNQNNFKYLESRRPWTQFKYIRNKKMLTFH